METEAAAALPKPTSPFQLTELDIAQIVDLIVMFVSILLLAPHVLLAILKQLIINAFAQLETLLTLEEIVFLVLLDVVFAVQPQIVLNASLLLYSKELFAKLTAITDSLFQDQFVWDVLKDVCNVLKISLASIVMLTFTSIKEAAMMFALLEQLVIDQLETGNVYLVTLPAKLASIIQVSVQAANQEKDILPLQLLTNLVYLLAMMEHLH